MLRDPSAQKIVVEIDVSRPLGVILLRGAKIVQSAFCGWRVNLLINMQFAKRLKVSLNVKMTDPHSTRQFYAAIFEDLCKRISPPLVCGTPEWKCARLTVIESLPDAERSVLNFRIPP